MTKCKHVTALAVAIGALVATGAAAKDIPSRPGSNPNAINISCYRGPLKTVAWDRPNAVFIEDLIRIGYTYPQAEAIGERVCRDEYGVGNGEYKIETLRRILKETPPG